MQTSEASKRVYMDNAATTWPKSETALKAAEAFIRDCGATAGRGAYQSAQTAEQWLVKARAQIARMVRAKTATDVAFCSSGTHALNAALKILRPGDHVLTSTIEHNSLLRPLKLLQSKGIISFDVVDSPSNIASRSRQAALIAIGHASNVTGKLSDLEAWRQVAMDHSATFLVDASQTLGYLPIDVQASGIDLLAAAGHKGLRALQGTGILVAAPRVQANLEPLLTGGTGLASESMEPDIHWPYNVEVGNLNLPGIVSMAAAAEVFLSDTAQYDMWQTTFQMLVAGLFEIESVRVLGTHLAEFQQHNSMPQCVPVVSILAEGWDVHDLAAILDSSFGIEVRAGYHCAALAHEGWEASNGTLRLSPSYGTSETDVEYVLGALREITRSTAGV